MQKRVSFSAGMELVLADSLQEEDEDEQSIPSSVAFISVLTVFVSPFILLIGDVVILVGSSPGKSIYTANLISKRN